MDAVTDALAVHLKGRFTVLELGSGPGPLASRILRRFRGCHVVAVDTDPVLLRVGRGALARYGPRIDWVLADLRSRRWSAQLPVPPWDGVVSSLALHWLERNEIQGLYRDLFRLIRPGGVFVNGDFLPSRGPGTGTTGTNRPKMDRSRRVDAASRLPAFRSEWEAWWGTVSLEAGFQPALRQRRLRLPGDLPPKRTTGPKIPASLEFHRRALREAGFRESKVVWQEGGFRTLVSLR